MMRLLLGGLSFIGETGPATFTIERDGIRGVGLGGVDMRREQVERPAAHGMFALPAYLTGRSIRWGGLVLTDSMAQQEHALMRLSGLLADGGYSRLTVQSEVTRWLDVQRASPEPPRILVPGKIASYSFEVWAPDPRMYGEVHDFPGGQVAVNRGNFPATPRLLVGAGSGGYTITGPNGRVVTVNANAPAEAHSIDFVTGGLFNGAGARVANSITVYQPWTVAPGLPGVGVSISGSRSISQRVTDTFV